MDPTNLPLAEEETILEEIPTSPKTIAYYSIKAAPLFGVWFIGLIAFLVFTFMSNPGNPITLLFQALALSGIAYLVGTIARWLWRVDVSQRDAWLTNKGIWSVSGNEKHFIPYLAIARVELKDDWMAKHLHLGGIQLMYREGQGMKKTMIVGVEDPFPLIQKILTKTGAENNNAG